MISKASPGIHLLIVNCSVKDVTSNLFSISNVEMNHSVTGRDAPGDGMPSFQLFFFPARRIHFLFLFFWL